jgi:hypothetical protein
MNLMPKPTSRELRLGSRPRGPATRNFRGLDKKERNMKTNAGLWIDHREAVIVVLTASGEKIKRIRSTAETQLRRSGEPGQGSFEPQEVPADDSRQRAYAGYLARYYDAIISHLGGSESVLIFGPGEAKGELKQRFEKHPDASRNIALQTADKMTEPEIVAMVRDYFHRAQTLGQTHRELPRRSGGRAGPRVSWQAK